ncbi:MAG: hypoxanthine phosphoribosyltransferase [Pirellulaceae bacterium]
MKILLTEQQIQEGISRLAAELNTDYQQRPITFIAVMTGSLVMLADLIRRLEMPIRVSLIQASSYRGGTQSGDLWLDDRAMLDITGRDCLLVDDIFDTGKTLAKVTERLQSMNPASIRSIVLLYKEGQQRYPIEPDYHVFRIPNEFVVGYGLDYQDLYRNLPYVGVMEEDDLAAHASS